jgi:hypothetical protein
MERGQDGLVAVRECVATGLHARRSAGRRSETATPAIEAVAEAGSGTEGRATEPLKGLVRMGKTA